MILPQQPLDRSQLNGNSIFSWPETFYFITRRSYHCLLQTHPDSPLMSSVFNLYLGKILANFRPEIICFWCSSKFFLAVPPIPKTKPLWSSDLYDTSRQVFWHWNWQPEDSVRPAHKRESLRCLLGNHRSLLFIFLYQEAKDLRSCLVQGLMVWN
jgi:hypothetical protein